MALAKQSIGFLSLVYSAYLLYFMACTCVQAAEDRTTEDRTTWCIAKPSTDENILLANMDYSCQQLGVDCSIIRKGGACYIPGNAVSHASLAMNLYYKAAGKNSWNCNFNGSGLIVYSDPSISNCIYQA